MSTLLKFTLSVIVLMPMTSSAFGQCGEQSVAASAKDAGAVFVGKVTKITKRKVAGWSIGSDSNKWEKFIRDVDLVSFEVTESIKPRGLKSVVVAKDANTFVGIQGIWLTEGQSYLIYATRRGRAGTGSQVSRWSKYYGTFPKALASEIDTSNGNVSPYETALCTRTATVNSTTPVELELLRLLHSKKHRRAKAPLSR
ncbi:MAG: hypothetical protein ABJB34_03495 [Acidobacteriota bacterium]